MIRTGQNLSPCLLNVHDCLSFHGHPLFFSDTPSEYCQLFHGWTWPGWVKDVLSDVCAAPRNSQSFTDCSILGLFIRNVISQVYGKIQNIFGLDL